MKKLFFLIFFLPVVMLGQSVSTSIKTDRIYSKIGRGVFIYDTLFLKKIPLASGTIDGVIVNTATGRILQMPFSTLSDSLGNFWAAQGDSIYNLSDGGVKIYSNDSFGTAQLRFQVMTDTANDEALIKVPNMQNSSGTSTLTYPYMLVYNGQSEGKVGFLPIDSAGGGGSDLWTQGSGVIYPTTLTDKVGIGTNAPTQPLHVVGNTYFYNDTVTGTEPNYYKTDISSMTGNHYNLRSTATMNNPDRQPYRIGGLLGEVVIDTTAEYVWNAVGQYGYIQHHGTDTLHLGATFFGYCTNRNTGTMDIASVFWANAFENSGGGSIPVAYQLYMADNAGVPGIGTLYGIYQDGKATNYFGGNIQLAESTDTTGIIYKGGSTFIHNFAPAAAAGYNTFIGRDAGNITMAGTGAESSKNLGVGHDALNALTTGYGNAAVGAWALKLNTTGYNNTAVGYNALGSNLVGTNNTAVGNSALVANTGNFNTAVGNQSATANVGGGYNTSMGYRSLYTNVTGNYNVALGHEALKVSTSSSNTAVGMRAGIATTSGGNNTFLGFNAGYSNVTGASNLFLGYRAGYNETGSSRFYVASDSTSWANGMAAGSKLLLYGDQSNADKANHTFNILAKTQIGAAKAPAYTLDVTGTGFFSDDLTLDDNLAFVGAGQISTTGNGTMTLDVGTGKVDVSGDLDYDLSHGYMYYFERSDVINLTNNVYSKLTNATNNLFTVDEANGITIAGDSITITRAGDYTLWFNFSATGAGSADVYRIKLYKNGSPILGSIKASALKSDISNVWHIQDLSIGDDIAIYLTNTADSDDITAVDCSIYIRKDHD